MRLSCLRIKPPPIDWSPIATLGLCASIGSYIGASCEHKNTIVFTVAPLIVLIAVCGLAQTRSRVRTVCIGLSLLLVCVLRSAIASNPQIPSWAILLDGELVQLRCNITSTPKVMPRTRGSMAQFDHRDQVTRFFARAVPQQPSNTARQQQSSNTVHQPCHITVRVDGICNLHKGEEIICIGWLRKSTTHTNQFTLYVSNPNTIQQITRKKPSAIQTIRQSARKRLSRGLTKEKTTLVTALFFGIRDMGWNNVSYNFRRAGMSHILAISGLHIGLILMVVLRFTSSLCRGRVFLFGTVLLVIGIVLLFVEPRPPVIRATVMVMIISIGRGLGTRISTIGLLGVTAIIMVALNPSDAGNIGYQLSFVVVAAICILAPHIKWRFIGPVDVNCSTGKMARYWISSMWITGLCAWMISSPLTAHVFGTCSPSGLLSNVPSIGILIASFMIGIVRLLLGWIEPMLDIIIRIHFSATLHGFSSIVTLAGNVPFGYLQGVQISWWLSSALLAWVVCWSLMIRNRWRVWLMLSILALAVFVETGVTSNKVVLTTVDVGHGTCHIIQHGSYVLMIDGGSMHNLDVGTNKIIPTLLGLGISHIDTIIVTHPDIDHCGGIVSVLQMLPVSRLLIAPQTYRHQTKPMTMVLDVAQHCHVQIVGVSKGWAMRVGDLRVSIVSPKLDDVYRSSNDTCIVTLVEAYGRKVLLTGDIDEKKIEELTPYLPTHIDVLELPHHGEWGENARVMVYTIRPRFILQSVNTARYANDQWEIPLNCDRLVTAIDGTITTTLLQDGNICISGSKQPVSMAICYASNHSY